MSYPIKKYGIPFVVFSIYGFLNYHPEMLLGLNSPHWGWIFSIVATLFILFLVRVWDRQNWKQKLGIDFAKKDIRNFLIATLVLLVCSYFIVGYVSMHAGYDFKPKLFYSKTYAGENYPFHYILANYIYYIPETFNEEMLVGALLLFTIESKFKKPNRNYIAIFVALIFSFMHQGLYRFSPVQSGELLTLTTIVSLFFVGVLRNALILKTRNIALSWAIHLSFNLVFFSGFFIQIKTQKMPSEPEVFNIVFGNTTMLAITGFFALLALAWLNVDRLKLNKPS